MTSLLMVTTVSGTLRAFLSPVGRHFRARGWRVDAAARGVRACDVCREAFDNTWDIQWSRKPWDIRSVVRCPSALRALVESQGYDIVHVHTPVAAFISRCALRTMRKRSDLAVVYTAHGFHFYEGGPWLRNRAFLAAEKLASRWTDHLVVINQEDRQAALDHALASPANVHFMPGGSSGIDTTVYDPASIGPDQVRAVRREIGVPEGAPLFVMVAEFIPRKRHEDALLALAIVRCRHTAYLALAGRGPTLKPMQGLADRLGVSAGVRFLGYRKDVPALMASSTAALLPSAQEGCPRTVMESLSMGLPTIGSDIRGTRDLLEGGRGVLVRVGDVEGFARAMSRVIEHPDEAGDMARRGRESMADHELPRVLEAYEALYAQVLGIVA